MRHLERSQKKAREAQPSRAKKGTIFGVYSFLEGVEHPYQTDNRLGEGHTTSATNEGKVNIVVIIVEMLILQSMISLSLVLVVGMFPVRF
ncbi:hypothetical protein [Vibrio alfacsensis]|uniref:hypothetical protein n=1 Tax=Vibrio alfacsensis TaxID=1074311 RepID=UPI0040693CC5